MLRFIRQFRYGLLGKGKLGRYFYYAAGEILLVVIGILLALQVNNWNENRKSRVQEKQYLNRLLVDIQQDILTFRQSIKDMNKGNETIEAFSEALRQDESVDTVLINRAREYFKYGSIYPVFTSATSTFDDLSSTGNLKVISDSDLRDKLVRHYARYQQVKERVRIDTDWALPLDASFAYDHHIMQFEPITGFLFPSKEEVFLASELIKKRDYYISNASVHYWINKDVIFYLEELINEAEAMIEVIKSELE